MSSRGRLPVPAGSPTTSSSHETPRKSQRFPIYNHAMSVTLRPRTWLRKIPGVSSLRARHLRRRFSSSDQYWEHRYAGAGNSGEGSYGRLAEFKAEVLNGFVAKHDVQSVVEFGCGDGNQLLLAEYPRYLGLDVSETAIETCRALFADDDTKSFSLLGVEGRPVGDLALSLDVIYHLVEDAVFHEHLTAVFDAAERFVVIYSSNRKEQERHQSPHVRHRKFDEWLSEHASGWVLIEHIPNRYPLESCGPDGSFADFYIYGRRP